MFVSYPYEITILGLGELEDLYYATCAKVQELLQGVDILLTNGFKGIHDTYFAYHNQPLHSLGPISVGAFRDALLTHQSILYSSELWTLLNRGVIEKNSRGSQHRHHDISPSNSTLQYDAQHGNRDGTEKYIDNQKHEFEQISGFGPEVEGLQDKSNMSCGMIFGELAEKYRLVAMRAELKGYTINREGTPEAPQAFQEEVLTREYISPYNLNERAKKLNVPGGPEMPCICDPECICAPLCASDPTQNCLCEENGLFVRVTEGMDIDDLDVPDLVRRKTQPSNSSGSSAASLNSIGRPSSEWSIHSAVYNDGIIPSSDQCRTSHETDNQISNQKTNITGSMAVSGPGVDTASSLDVAISMSDALDLSEEDDDLFWQDGMSIPRLRISDFTLYELRQPFSKQCDHPPKRQSVTERLFKSKARSMATQKGSAAVDQPMQNYNINGNTSKVVKQPNKRSLADISFTGLRLTRRRG